jgi:hypothetical protein
MTESHASGETSMTVAGNRGLQARSVNQESHVL